MIHTMENRGIVSIRSLNNFDQTVENISNLLRARSLTLYALIDHAGEAKKIKMQMPPSKLFVFGNPHAGTPLMQAVPTSALDLPLKILVWQDNDLGVWITFNSPGHLQERHDWPVGMLQNIKIVKTIAVLAGERLISGPSI
jgi:uncharacterized protein (DUF302 family)